MCIRDSSGDGWGRDVTEATTPDPPNERSYRDGQRVRHAAFGEGLVVSGEITKFDEEVLVMFETVGLKKLAVSLAHLEIIS